MARIRAIKPSAFTSESLANVSVAARWTFAGLWTYVDDEGRGKADPRLIKGQLWPLDDHVSPKDVAGYLDELEDEGCICRYESGGREYLHVVNWHHQTISKATPSRLPDCSRASHDDSGDSRERSGESPLGTGNKEEEVEGNKEEEGSPGNPGGDRPLSFASRQRLAEPDFAEWYELYPRKKKRPDALRAYTRALEKLSHEDLMSFTHAYVASVASKDPNYLPYPATWLNGEQWSDEPDRPSPRPPSARDEGWAQGMDIAAELREQEAARQDRYAIEGGAA